jgi:hypothetical protein
MEDDNLPLRRRVPGEARSAPVPSRRPVLSEAQLRRMRAALDAARAEGAAPDKDSATPLPRDSRTSPAGTANATTGSPATAGTAREAAAERDVKPSHAAVSSFIRRSRRSATPLKGAAAPPPAAAKRPELPPGEAPSRTVPAYGPRAAAPVRPDTLPKRSPTQAAGDTQHTAPPPPRTPQSAHTGTGPETLPKRSPTQPADDTQDTAPLPPTAAASSAPAVAPRLLTQPTRPDDAATRAETGDPSAAATGGTTAAASRHTRSPDQRERARTARIAVPAETSPLTPSAARLRASYGRRRMVTPVRVAAAAVVVVTLGAAAAFLLHSAPRAAGARKTPTVLERQEDANRTLAATWASQQLSPSTVVACDAATCQALRERGFPAANLRLLQKSSSYPLSSQVVIETAAVRGIFGSSLDAQAAPEVITTIGAGSAVVVIRVIAQHGVAAYDRELASDLSVRKRTGIALLGGARIKTHPVARQQLADGDVDTRLLYAITALAAVAPIDIVDFGSIAIDPSHGLPLRYADLAEQDKATHKSPTAYVNSLVKALTGIRAPFGPIRSQTVKLPDRMDVLRIEVSAPSPLGLLGTGRQ